MLGLQMSYQPWVMEDSDRRAGRQRRESLELHGASMFQ